MKKLLCFAVLLLLLAAGCSNEEAQAEVEGEAKNLEEIKTLINEAENTLNELDTEVEAKENELSAVETDLSDLENEFKSRESEFSELEELADNRDTVESNLSEAESKLESLESEISDAQSELEGLEASIVEAQDSPIELTAGEWVVGVDIPEGRYEASGSSNFVVYSSSGNLNVNTILRDGNYVFFASEGDFIESSAAVSLTPVE